jgi:hypothetical protein
MVDARSSDDDFFLEGNFFQKYLDARSRVSSAANNDGF